MRPRGPGPRGPEVLRALARIADANANRAREGLRVAEDLVRLGLGSAAAAGRMRRLRRGVTSACRRPPLSGLPLQAARDAAGDPAGGTRREGPRMPARRGLADLASANLRRAQESLRVLEEVERTLGGTGRRFRALRFGTYDAESRVITLLRRGFER